MAVRVKEAALPMRSPRHCVVSHRVVAVGPGCCRATDERVRIVHEYLNPDCRGAKRIWALPAVALWLGEKERRPSTSRPMTEPRFHSSVAPRARWYQADAAAASGTASMREMTVTSRRYAPGAHVAVARHGAHRGGAAGTGR
jgi:hypothetical protein